MTLGAAARGAPGRATAVAARRKLTEPDLGGGMDEDAGIGELTAPEAAAEARRAVRALFLDDSHVHGCAESTFVALKRSFALPDPEDPSAAMALNGGIAYSGATCGAITGAALALGMLAARRIEDHREAKRVARLLTAELLHRFEEEFGSSRCRDLTGADLTTEEGHQAFIDSDAWRDGCLRQLESAVSDLAPLVREDVWASTLARIGAVAMPPQDDEPRNADRGAAGQRSERTGP